jgi:ribosomal protein S7
MTTAEAIFSGNLAVWFMNGGQVISSAGLGNVGPSWSVQSLSATAQRGRVPVRVKKRRKTMSAVTAAFAESSHGGLLPN